VHIAKRQHILGDIAARLKFLAETFTVAVVATNHVVAKSKGRSSEAPDTMLLMHKDDDGAAAPALGNSWSHCVNTRLVLARIAGFDHAAHIGRRSDTAGDEVLLTVHKSPLVG